ncbi:MAG TPA: STAS domain-containing protein, partial [Ramlibacter sp.]|nr:STAS domain-containing protein [Ramlibacter sp.]
LAGILLFVAWNMGEWHEFAQLRKYSTHYRVLMLGTFFLTVVFDLTVAVQVGLVAACALFIRRMSSIFSVELVTRDGAVLHYKLYGALFFGAVAKIDEVVQAVENGPHEPVVVLDTLQLVHLDTSGLDSLRQLHKVVLLRGGTLHLENLQPQPEEVINRSGFGAELTANRASPEVSG